MDEAVYAWSEGCSSREMNCNQVRRYGSVFAHQVLRNVRSRAIVPIRWKVLHGRGRPSCGSEAKGGLDRLEMGRGECLLLTGRAGTLSAPTLGVG